MDNWPALWMLAMAYRGALGIFLGFGVMWLARQEEKEKTAGQIRDLRQKDDRLK